jgi:hypothetical protein
MSLRDNEALRSELQEIARKLKYDGGWPDLAATAILDAVERHLAPAALPGVDPWEARRLALIEQCAKEAEAYDALPLSERYISTAERIRGLAGKR